MKCAYRCNVLMPCFTYATLNVFFSEGETASLEGWLRFAEDREPCLKSLSFFCDCLPPPVLNYGVKGWIPTIEYTAHIWGKPSPMKWLRVRFVSSHLENGMLHTDGDIWSEDGTKLLAKSRQLARVLSPKSPGGTLF